MTTLEQIAFAAKIQIGTEIIGYGGQSMIVTKIDDKRFYGYSKFCFDKYGKKTNMSLPFTSITNPHLNKNFKLA